MLFVTAGIGRGFSSAVATSEMIYVTGMDNMVCFHAETGEVIWKSKPIGASRSNMSPILIEHIGEEYVIASTYKDSCLWISNGWDVPSVMLEIAPDGRSVSEKFKDRTFDNQNQGVVLVDGFLYGSNFTGRNSGKWVCMNWDTGEIKWIGDFHNKGPVIYADGMLYCYEEKRGNLALVKADPEKFKVIGSFRVTEGAGPYWARPTIFNQVLLVRHGDVLVGYKVKG